MSLDSKGQASAEFIFVTLIFIIIAGSLVNLASSEIAKTDTGNLGQARMIGEGIAEAINTVYINGPGYSVNVTLKNLTNSSSDYIVHVYSTGNLSVMYHSNNITIKLIPTNVANFDMKNGTKYQVTNSNGVITFSKA